jgi:hypothetical protein
MHFEKLMRHIDQVLIDRGLRRLRQPWDNLGLALMLPVAEALPIITNRIFRPRLMRER